MIVSGYLLTDDISIQVPAGFEVSLSEEGEYAASLVLTPDGGEVAETYVYARLSADLSEGAYAGQITLSSEGAYTVTLDLSGTVERPL